MIWDETWKSFFLLFRFFPLLLSFFLLANVIIDHGLGISFSFWWIRAALILLPFTFTRTRYLCVGCFRLDVLLWTVTFVLAGVTH